MIKTKKHIVSALLAASLMACANVPEKKPETLQQVIVLDAPIGDEVIESFQKKFTTEENLFLAQYLSSIAKEMVKDSESEINFKVNILSSDQNISWQNFSFPNGQIFISKNLLKQVEYENELYGIIALEIAKIFDRLFAIKYQEEMKIKEFRNEKKEITSKKEFINIFNFDKEKIYSILPAAVWLVYSAGHDPRGIASIYKKYQKNSQKFFYDETFYSEMFQRVYREISRYTPLKNPKNSKISFEKFKERFHKS